MKEFKVAHIVPVSHLAETEKNHYHMCLAHLVPISPEYCKHFAKMAADGKYVLMDNGAAEGNQLSPEKLLDAYEKINPTEIVLPDTLYGIGSTIQKGRNFMSMLDNVGMMGKYRLMAVPQGKTLGEWKACATVFVQDTRINSIGISKFLNIATKDKYARFKAAAYLEKLIKKYHRDDLEVHLLGCDEGPLVVKMCQEEFGFIRGCDSAFSYLAAQAGRAITVWNDSRPSGTIDFIGGKYYSKTYSAMEDFNMLAGVKDNGYDLTWQ